MVINREIVYNLNVTVNIVGYSCGLLLGVGAAAYVLKELNVSKWGGTFGRDLHSEVFDGRMPFHQLNRFVNVMSHLVPYSAGSQFIYTSFSNDLNFICLEVNAIFFMNLS